MSCNFLGTRSIDIEDVGGLTIGFLVFFPDEVAGVSTSFLEFWYSKGIA
jgi:hypothetical protein